MRMRSRTATKNLVGINTRIFRDYVKQQLLTQNDRERNTNNVTIPKTRLDVEDLIEKSIFFNALVIGQASQNPL